ncbi:hypothetical protein AB0873_09505 [Micromonospora sp. NPDC047707]|uniref:hypothetical protein n=1 Tax=Micromonospora sp. NPDC047707 TaxID=3154498 RepID=UPI003456CE2D
MSEFSWGWRVGGRGSLGRVVRRRRLVRLGRVRRVGDRVAARGKKLSDAYLELRADDSKLSGDVKVKATKAAKGFGAQLNNALKALNLDPVDVKASPAEALAAIEATRTRLRQMSDEAESVEMRVRTERALTQLERFRKQLGAVADEPVKVEADPSPARRQIDQLQKRLTALGVDPPVTIDADPQAALAAIRRVDQQLEEVSRKATSVQVRMDVESARADLGKLRERVTVLGEEGAEGFSARFAARVGPLIASMPLSAPMAAAVGAAGLAAAPSLAAILSGAVVGGAGAGGIVGGAVLAARDPRVKAAGAELGAFVLGDLERRASSFTPDVLDAIEDIRRGWISLGPDLSRIFASSRFIDPLVDGAVSGGRKLVAGLADAVDEADPVMDALGRSFDAVGDAAGEAFTQLAQDADEGASAIDDLTMAVTRLIQTASAITHAGATVKGWTEEVDKAVDRGRYWIEDNSYLAEALGKVGVKLDLTADGFKAGTPQAEAYRKATLGTAEAADFATLKAAGYTDAQIAAADASGRYRQQLDDARAAAERLGGAHGMGAQSIEEFRRKLEELNTYMSGNISANLAAERSQNRLEEAIDRAADAAKRNGDGIDRNIPKQRANREALVGIADAALQAAEDIYANTKSHDLAAVATERGRKKFLETAAAMGVEKGEAKKLADQLFGIPKEVDTRADFHPDNAGVKAWKQTLSGIDRDIFIRAHFDLINDREVAMALRLGRLEDGGPVEGEGPKGKDSTLIYAAPGEHMLTAAEVDRMGGHQAVFAFRRQLMTVGSAAAVPGAVPRYADGGPIGSASVQRTAMPGWTPPVFYGAGRQAASMEALSANLGAMLVEMRALRRDVQQGAVATGRAVGRELTGATEHALTKARLR